MTTTHPLRMCKSHVMNEMFVVVVVVAVIIVNIIIEKNHSISASMKFYEKKVVFFFSKEFSMENCLSNNEFSKTKTCFVEKKK